MPEQPADPLHYEMKIPPVPDAQNRQVKAEREQAIEESDNAGSAKDANVVRGDDKPQSVRHPE